MKKLTQLQFKIIPKAFKLCFCYVYKITPKQLKKFDKITYTTCITK